MQATSDSAAQLLGSSSRAPLPAGLRTELSVTHGSANKLLATRIDAIVTADLTTAKDEARAKRKSLVATAEALIERIEEQIKQIDRRKEHDAGVQPPLEQHGGAAAAPASL